MKWDGVGIFGGIRIGIGVRVGVMGQRWVGRGLSRGYSSGCVGVMVKAGLGKRLCTTGEQTNRRQRLDRVLLGEQITRRQ